MKLYVSLMVIVGASVIATNGHAWEARLECDAGYTYKTCAESNPNGEYPSGCPIINAREMTQYRTSERCAKTNIVWARGVGIQGCDTCVNGGSIQTATTTVPGNCTAVYTYCECTTTATCTNGAWTTIRAGYQSRTKSTAVCNTCKTSTEYRCAPGYYGTTSNGSTGCTRCPTVDGVAGTSAGGNGTTITSCYMATGTTFSNTTGSGRYDGNSYYCN